MVPAARRNSTVNFIPLKKKDTSSSSSYQILFLLTTGKRIYILSMSRGSRTMNLKMSLQTAGELRNGYMHLVVRDSLLLLLFKTKKKVVFFFFFRKDPPTNGRKADSLQPLPTFKLLREEEPSGSSASGHLGSDETQEKTGRNQKTKKELKGTLQKTPSSSVSTIRMMD